MQKRIMMLVLVGVLLLGGTEDQKFTIAPGSAVACDYCLLTQGLSPLETTRGFGFRLDGRYTVLNSLYTGINEIENHDGEKESHFTTQLTAFYNLTDRFTLIGVLPFPHREISLDEHAEDIPQVQEEPEHGHHSPGSSFGVGDLTLLGRYKILSKHNFQQTTALALQAGIKAPTGATDALDDSGEFLDAHVQPGTGAWSFLAGFSFNFVKNRFGVAANLLYAENTTGKAGDDDYRFGNWLNADVTAKYPLISGKRNLFVSLGLNSELRAREELNGAPISNTGGEVLYLAPGLQLMLSRFVILEASLMYPFYHNLNGDGQLGEDFKGFFGFNYVLN